METGEFVESGFTLDEAINKANTHDACYIIDSVTPIDNGLIRGCTNPEADNYNPDAEEDNHSCITCSILGTAYNPLTHRCEASCEWWESILGCGWFPPLWDFVKGIIESKDK